MKKERKQIEEAVQADAEEGRLSCTRAFYIAQRLDVRPLDIGIAADTLGIRLVECQLGLFGYGPQKRAVPPLNNLLSDPSTDRDTDLRRAIYKALVDSRLPCAQAWRIARELGLAKPQISAACDALKIKIGPCQLGAF